MATAPKDSKNKTDFKDIIIVSGLFFLFSSDFFDKWLREMFSDGDQNPMVLGLIKTAAFAAGYYVYCNFVKGASEEKSTS